MMMQLGGTTAATTTDTPVTAPVSTLASTPNADAAEHGNNGTSGDGSAMDEADIRSFGGNRWPRQETLALLKIRSDMGIAFRDATVKGPLWEEVSRKLADLGYNRSAKKCKEKFENVYKYHKRTKEGRTGKSDGRTYRFFDQLEALENQSHPHQFQRHKPSSTSTPPRQPPAPPPPPPLPPPATTTKGMTTQHTHGTVQQAQPQSVVASTMPIANITMFPPPRVNVTPPPQPALTTQTGNAHVFPSVSGDFFRDSTSSSSTSSDLEIGKKKRKRKWKGFFERLMRQVVEKQEELQKRFLEAVEKREQERMTREDAWRMQEMARINREREILAQERSMASAKDAAVMAFLQKLSDQQQSTNHNVLLHNQNSPLINTQPLNQNRSPPPPPPPPPTHQSPQPQPLVLRAENEDLNVTPTSSSRWPKVEIEALIKLRTSLDSKYQENGPKGPLWEEISAGMRRLGYNRSSKRCKEKWENINKYFKKVKESNKKRPEDSKTCPYFHQLEALYREKNKNMDMIKAENTVPLMVQPEQQWPPAPQPPTGVQSAPHSEHRTAMEREHYDDDEEEEREAGEHEDDEDDEDGGGEFEIVSNNKTVPLGTS